MKICAYCERENEDVVKNCCECGTDEFKPQQNAPEAAVEEESSEPGAFAPRTPAMEEPKQAFVTLRKCRTVDEADLLAAQLKMAGVEAYIPDEAFMSALNSNAGGFVRLNVPAEQYDQAMEILADDKELADSASEPETESTKANRTLPLSSWMTGLMFMLPAGFCPTLLIAAFICQSYRKKGFARRAEEAYLSLLVGVAFWLLIGLIGLFIWQR